MSNDGSASESALLDPALRQSLFASTDARVPEAGTSDGVGSVWFVALNESPVFGSACRLEQGNSGDCIPFTMAFGNASALSAGTHRAPCLHEITAPSFRSSCC